MDLRGASRIIGSFNQDLRSLKTAYQHADPETMLVALEHRRQLREVAR